MPQQVTPESFDIFERLRHIFLKPYFGKLLSLCRIWRMTHDEGKTKYFTRSQGKTACQRATRIQATATALA